MPCKKPFACPTLPLSPERVRELMLEHSQPVASSLPDVPTLRIRLSEEVFTRIQVESDHLAIPLETLVEKIVSTHFKARERWKRYSDDSSSLKRVLKASDPYSIAT